jgi:hypothetical protein
MAQLKWCLLSPLVELLRVTKDQQLPVFSLNLSPYALYPVDIGIKVLLVEATLIREAHLCVLTSQILEHLALKEVQILIQKEVSLIQIE